MRNESYRKDSRVRNVTHCKEVFSVRSNDSYRHPVTRKLMLRSNAYDLYHCWVTHQKHYPGSYPNRDWPPDDANNGAHSVGHSTTCRDKAVERFYSRLGEGRAALGITIVQYAEARGMILDRLKKMSNIFDRQLRRNRRRGRRYTLSSGAGDILEYNFGWVPLLSEAYALCATAFVMAIPPLKVTGRARERHIVDLSVGGYPSYEREVLADNRCTVDAFIHINNPNLWLADRLGVINPAVVAWDAVPWSFLVNAFSNMNAVLSQHTNLVGLSVQNISTTQTTKFFRTTKISNAAPYGYYDTTVAGVIKNRTGGPVPSIEFRGRVPELSLQSCAIAASLLVQKLRKFVDPLL